MFRRSATGEIEEVALERLKDSTGDYFVVPMNSLVFIRTRQELRVPFYMIGRHNLKIEYVYKGLLLGTGPQVDPGYVGNLIIPLHNFTSVDVALYTGDTFVSIDFVRTTSFFRQDQTIPDNLDDLYREYEKSKCLIERFKVRVRNKLGRYLGGAKPMSQMGILDFDFKKLVAESATGQAEVGAKIKESDTKFEKLKGDAETRQIEFDLTRL